MSRLHWTDTELDQLSTILDEYRMHIHAELDTLRFYYPRLGDGVIRQFALWSARAKALRDKIEAR